MKAYYMDDTQTDYREDHDSGVAVSAEELQEIGVLYQHLDSMDKVDQLARERDYKNRDEIVISPTSFGSPEALKTKLDMFFTTHIHEDEEIRYIKEGDGFFDLLNEKNQKWIRVRVQPNDLLIVPAGIYHRFTLDTHNFIKAVRLFKDEPKWTPLNFPVENNNYREEYLKSIGVN
jgi:1,2-dihydroxy-3-keto-5-methylthiopentene dioxygenase